MFKDSTAGGGKKKKTVIQDNLSVWRIMTKYTFFGVKTFVPGNFFRNFIVKEIRKI